MRIALAIYIAGVLVGLWRVDGRPLTRIGLALLWPLGPAVFLITLAILLAASLVAFPVFGVVVAGLGVLYFWLVM